MIKKILLVLLFCNICAASAAIFKDIQKPGNFVSEVFANKAPKAKKMWIKGEVKNNIEKILQHPFSVLRLRYWKKGSQCLWIIDEIGKEEAITFGIVVQDNEVLKAKVLTYRETRGFEIIRKAFQDQYHKTSLEKSLKLNKNIDGISGATLSVRAMSKVVRIALYLSTLTTENE
jgi:hypothetical protein